MKSVSSMSFIMLGLTLALLMNVSQAQNTPADFLAPHNTTRAAVSVGPMTWDTTIANYALNYANQKAASDCKLVHSGGPYGENLAWSSSTTFTAAQAVNLWVAEKQYYTYSTNSCATGKVCGHYTQVVWRNSIRLGCARASCTTGGTFVICSYDPPGNYQGQLPY